MERRCTSARLASAFCVALMQVGTVAAQAAADPGPMPHPAQFMRKPADAGSVQPCRDNGAIRTRPDDLLRSNEQARIASSVLRSWGASNYEFRGQRPGCTNWDLVITKWQATVGLPETGIFTQAEVDSVIAERDKIAAQWRTAYDAWTAAGTAGGGSRTGAGVPERVARERGLAGAAAQGGVARAAPVGPAEKQAFGLSLGAPLRAQLPTCRPKEGFLASGFDTTSTCIAPARQFGRSSANHEIELEAEWVSDSTSDALAADGIAVILFSEADQPGIIAANVKAVLVEGRLEGLGFRPTDKRAVLEAFEGRYGKADIEAVPMKNNQGGAWIGERYRFRRNDVSATVNCVEFNTTQCSYAQVLTDRGRDSLADNRQDEVRRGVGF